MIGARKYVYEFDMGIIKKYFAEFETDKVIREKYFNDFTYKGIIVEVGGATPEYLSMSRHFNLNGWRCIIIEPNPKFVQMHKRLGNEIYAYACGTQRKDNVDFEVAHVHSHDNITNDDHSFSSLKIKTSYLEKYNIRSLPYTTIRVNVRTLDQILKEANVKRIDILSIDVEGHEIEVMKGFSIHKYNPIIVVLENVLHDHNYVDYMINIGYELHEKVEYNYIFKKSN